MKTKTSEKSRPVKVENAPEESEIDLQKSYPSIELAYPIAVNSYESAIKRLDSLDTKMQNMMGFALTLFIVIPTLGNANRIPFNSWLFWLSIILTIISFILSLYARKIGNIKLLDPKVLYEKWLHLPETEFKKDLIYHAGQDFNEMCDLIDYKWTLNLISLIVFTFGLFLAVLWVSGAVGF